MVPTHLVASFTPIRAFPCRGACRRPQRFERVGGGPAGRKGPARSPRLGLRKEVVGSAEFSAVNLVFAPLAQVRRLRHGETVAHPPIAGRTDFVCPCGETVLPDQEAPQRAQVSLSQNHLTAR